MKVRYFHSRVPTDIFENAQKISGGSLRGKPPLIFLSAYNRKRHEFINPYERENCIPDPRGGMTEAIIYDEVGNRYVGTAYCSLSDCFSYKIGRELAYQRAYANYMENVPY